VITTLAPWFGGNRLLAPQVGRALLGCHWVGIPFAGGMAEVRHIRARTLLVNDLHRHVINLARVVRSDALRPQLVRRLRRKLFHPDELADSQAYCRATEPTDPAADLDCATAYFVCCWMGRSAKAGITDQFNGRPAIRWRADGGDSVVRYTSALRSLASWGKTFRRCQFETVDAFDFLARCEDRSDNGIYADPPFPQLGRRYKHNAGQTDAEETAWHARLRDALARFRKTLVVCRFYDAPLIRELYPPGPWLWRPLVGRKQTNQLAEAEVLVMNEPRREQQPTLFDQLAAT
jgi:hypothetical protein